ncbi:MAG: pyridoxamine 5'-phosphate oxidase, partial [Phycisphaerales bacterium]|nr:pyridoxamine 5'-phosphate oxidase [Phycisphaerales bacterium]
SGGASHNPTAMTLATATRDGAPSARVVLCKAVEVSGDLVFFTNFTGRKGRELAENPRAACVFHWDSARRQARVEGRVERVSEAESDAYFASRPLLSRLGAWASRQSEPMESRGALLKDVIRVAGEHGVSLPRLLLPESMNAGVHVPRPPFWGGFRLRAERIELWCGSKSGRLHDRAVWVRESEGDGGGAGWRGRLLYP